MKKFFVTGGLGFIGSNLIKYLLELGYQVINLDKVTYVYFTISKILKIINHINLLKQIFQTKNFSIIKIQTKMHFQFSG